MKIHLLTVSDRQPAWVQSGYDEFAKRLTKDIQLSLREVAPAKRGKTGNAEKWRDDEAQRLLAALPRGSITITLDEKGECPSTAQLAHKLDGWLHGGSDVALLVGGPDGLDPRCHEAAQWTWSLSPLTLPHGLVRVVVAEQLYRAWSILHNHPYHRV